MPVLTETDPHNALATVLPVMEQFYTLQGEGFHQGRAAYFVRLGGCDVGCVWCDVKESWDAEKHPKLSIDTIVQQVDEETGNGQTSLRTKRSRAKSNRPIVVITGGEPLMHDLTLLTQKLRQKGFQTNIETSGSHPLSGSWDWICLSPKKFKAPLPEIFVKASELKIIIYNKSDFDWAEKHAEKVLSSCKLYLQPEWSRANEMTPSIIDYIKKNPQWELSLQIHKYINVP